MHACTQQFVDWSSASVRLSDSFVNLDSCVEDGFFLFFGDLAHHCPRAMSNILFAKHVSFEHSVSSPRSVITSRREEKKKAKVFSTQSTVIISPLHPSLISPHFAAGAVGGCRSAASFLATESTGTFLIPRLMTGIAGHANFLRTQSSVGQSALPCHACVRGGGGGQCDLPGSGSAVTSLAPESTGTVLTPRQMSEIDDNLLLIVRIVEPYMHAQRNVSICHSHFTHKAVEIVHAIGITLFFTVFNCIKGFFNLWNFISNTVSPLISRFERIP